MTSWLESCEGFTKECKSAIGHRVAAVRRLFRQLPRILVVAVIDGGFRCFCTFPKRVVDAGHANRTSRIVDQTGEETIIVSNGPVTEEARRRADWRFRAIFGKDAFNRLSMHSNLEARLPVGDAE